MYRCRDLINKKLVSGFSIIRFLLSERFDGLVSLNNWTRCFVGSLDGVKNQEMQSMARPAGRLGSRRRGTGRVPIAASALREIKRHSFLCRYNVMGDSKDDLY